MADGSLEIAVKYGWEALDVILAIIWLFEILAAYGHVCIV